MWTSMETSLVCVGRNHRLVRGIEKTVSAMLRKLMASLAEFWVRMVFQ